MPKLLVLEERRVEIADLYAEMLETIKIAERTAPLWGDRTAPFCEAALADCKQFAKPQKGVAPVTTPQVKGHFAILTTLGNEVVMTNREKLAVYCVAEVAHAAAHLGHLAVAINAKDTADRVYESLQRGYVQFGLAGSRRYAHYAGVQDSELRTTTSGMLAPTEEETKRSRAPRRTTTAYA